MIQWWQIILLTLYAGYQIYDELSIYSAMSSPVFAGLFTGLVMGDMTVGLTIGAGMQLVVLGVGTFGGASKVDANTGTIIATAFSVALHMKPETALAALAVPVAALMIQLDVLGRFTNTFFAHRIDAEVEKQNYKGIERNFIYGTIPWTFSRMIPVGLALSFGGSIVSQVVKFLNTDFKWLGDGLAVAGAALPAVGFAILLRYLPVKKNIAYLILGFILTALLTTVFTGMQTLGTAVAGLDKNFTTIFNALPMLAIALVGLALAIISYKRNTEGHSLASNAAPTSGAQKQDTTNSEGEIEDDEL